MNSGKVCIVYLRNLVLFVFTVSSMAAVSLAIRLIRTTPNRHTMRAEFSSTIPAWSQCSWHSGDLDVVHGLHSFIHSLDRVDSRGPSRRLPVTMIGSPVPFCSDAKWRAVCNVVEPRLTWTTAWSTPAWVWTYVPSHRWLAAGLDVLGRYSPALQHGHL